VTEPRIRRSHNEIPPSRNPRATSDPLRTKHALLMPLVELIKLSLGLLREGESKSMMEMQPAPLL
jgi:hypothetical protein